MPGVRRVSLAVSAGLLVLGAVRLSAQPPALPALGERVRVVRPGDHPVVGTLVSLDGTGWRIRRSGVPDTVVFPDDTYRFQRSAGRQGHALLGAGIGAAIGLTVVALCPRPEFDDTQALVCGVTGRFALIEGPFLGVIIGANIKTQRWVTVAQGPDRERRARVALGWAGGGITIGVHAPLR